jgi:CDP-paratose synthetase
MNRFVITGATGVLGSALVRALLARGDQVAVLSRDPHRLRRINQLPVSAYPYSAEGMLAVLAAGKVDAVIHAACCYGKSGESADKLLEINALVPLQIALAAGTRIGAWVSIGTGLPPAVSFYAQSKKHFVDWLELLPHSQLARRVVVELEHFYGPHDDPEKFVTRVVRSCLRHEALNLTIGTQQRDFIHLEDVVSGILHLINHTQSYFSRIPLGSGEAISVRDLVERIHAISASHAELRFGTVALRSGEPDCCKADITIMRSLGWKPTIALDDGITALVASESKIMRTL